MFLVGATPCYGRVRWRFTAPGGRGPKFGVQSPGVRHRRFASSSPLPAYPIPSPAAGLILLARRSTIERGAA
jgi:hypothetical protein